MDESSRLWTSESPRPGEREHRHADGGATRCNGGRDMSSTWRRSKRGDTIDARPNIYAAGSVLCAMATGQVPFGWVTLLGGDALGIAP